MHTITAALSPLPPPQMVESADQFAVTQFGLSAFVWEGSRYEAHTFNFYTFSRPFEDVDRRFLCQARSSTAQHSTA
jgi:hypothetical protein